MVYTSSKRSSYLCVAYHGVPVQFTPTLETGFDSIA